MRHTSSLVLRYTAASDPGRHRERNEDSGLASPRLLAIADGMGGHVHGEVASTIAVNALVELDEWLRTTDPRAVDLPGVLSGAVAGIAARLAERAHQEPDLVGMGNTLTVLAFDGAGSFAVAHIGDSRAYLLRNGSLHQLTTDHTLVQSLVDEGRLSEVEAATHPRRSMLMRAMQSTGSGEPDLAWQPVLAGDRYLLCSDGLTDFVTRQAIHDTLAATAEPTEAADRLIALANNAGGPDNVTCVVADIVSITRAPEPARQVVGAAAYPPNLMSNNPMSNNPVSNRPVPDNQASDNRRRWLPHWGARRMSG